MTQTHKLKSDAHAEKGKNKLALLSHKSPVRKHLGFVVKNNEQKTRRQ